MRGKKAVGVGGLTFSQRLCSLLVRYLVSAVLSRRWKPHWVEELALPWLGVVLRKVAIWALVGAREVVGFEWRSFYS